MLYGSPLGPAVASVSHGHRVRGGEVQNQNTEERSDVRDVLDLSHGPRRLPSPGNVWSPLYGSARHSRRFTVPHPQHLLVIIIIIIITVRSRTTAYVLGRHCTHIPSRLRGLAIGQVQSWPCDDLG